MEISNRDFYRLAGAASKRSTRLVIKVKGLVLSSHPFKRQDGSIAYQNQIVDMTNETMFPFVSDKMLKKGIEQEVKLLLTGWAASEAHE